MSKVFTKRNHYNPCFWTALWNESYYNQYCSGQSIKNSCREQVVYALNVCSGKIYPTKVEKVHFHSDWGVADIRPESIKSFCARWFPKKYEEICKYVEANPANLYLDFEEVFTGLERSVVFSPLMEIAKICNLASDEQKAPLICHLMIHAMRSHEFVAASIDRMKSLNIDKWEYFWLLKHIWGNRTFLARAAIIPTLGEWT